MPRMPRALQSTAAFNEFIDALVAIRDGYVLHPDRFADSELDTVEGFRFVMQLISEGTELFAEADPDRPRFSSIVTPARKFLGDNPDSIYYQAVIRGGRSYRVSGVRDGQCYISYTVHGADPAGGINGPVLADVNDRDLQVGSDGRYELIISPNDKPAGEKRDWLKIPSTSRLVLVRNYFLQKQSIHNDPDAAIKIHIEPLDDPGTAPPLDDATYATRLRDSTAFIKATTLGLRNWKDTPEKPAPFVSTVPNSVGKPFSFRQAAIAAAGAVDIHYSSGTFDLQPDEALVMEGHLPKSVFTNVMLWNIHMQTLDYRSRQSSLNSAQMQTGADGSYRIVISARDPKVPNWMDTEGHQRGTIFWRFLLAEEDPEHPRCRVVKVDEVASLT